ncbi:MAG: branched-chain amino acid ABC transporter substrate-binding protein [Leptothrix sp. (in: b-proteobacteria)]
MTRTRQALAAAVLLVTGLMAASAQAAPFKVTLLQMADDPRLDKTRVERAYLGQPGGSAADAIQVAIKEASFELDASGTGVTLEAVSVASAAAAKEAAAKAEKGGAVALVTDLPADWTLAATAATALVVLNVGNPADRLREADCRPRLLHLIPSERMRADALAQTLASQRWQQVLLLTGPSADDATRSAVAQAAIKRFGLKLAGSKPFKLSGDPRERDLANPRLLTQGTYDVVWVVDSQGEFARGLPYRTVLPRPVVGDAGLAAVAWMAQFERYGAPQVSRRFAKAAMRPMTGADWSAWMAGKAITAAAAAEPKARAAAFGKLLIDADLDGSKGVQMTFRAWDGQLRQPLLLTDGQGVVATAPADGVLHPKNNLDTLGADAPEKLCTKR